MQLPTTTQSTARSFLFGGRTSSNPQLAQQAQAQQQQQQQQQNNGAGPPIVVVSSDTVCCEFRPRRLMANSNVRPLCLRILYHTLRRLPIIQSALQLLVLYMAQTQHRPKQARSTKLEEQRRQREAQEVRLEVLAVQMASEIRFRSQRRRESKGRAGFMSPKDQRSRDCPDSWVSASVQITIEAQVGTEVPYNDRHELFLQKLRQASVVFDFNDASTDLAGKQLKASTLQEMLEWISTQRGVITEAVYPEVVSMVSDPSRIS